MKRSTFLIAGLIALLAAGCSSSGAIAISASSSGNAASSGSTTGAASIATSGSGSTATSTTSASSGSGASVSAATGASSGAASGSTSGAGGTGGTGAVGDACHPFAMPSADSLFGSDKRVFAHYFSFFALSIGDVPASQDYYNVNFLSPQGESDKWYDAGGYLRQRPLPVPVGPDDGGYLVENMEREVKLAMAAGITGFAIDILGPDQWDAGTQLQNLLTAANNVDPRFKIVAMLDLSALNGGYQNDAGLEATVAEITLNSVAANPASYRLPDGRLVVSSFYAEGQPASWWSDVFAHVDAGAPIAFVPVFLGWTGFASDYASVSYGYGDWGTATPGASAASEPWPSEAHDGGKIFMMPVDPQQYRPKDFFFEEAEGSHALQAAWYAAIDGGSDWVQLVTWSDFSESSDIEPYTDATLAPSIGTGFYDLNLYYATQFLTGQPPPITSDVLYYFYRRQATGAPGPAQQQPTVCNAGTAEDIIEVLSFLTAPGKVQITVGGQTFSQDAVAGVSEFTIPQRAGVPTFSLVRDGGTVISFAGTVEIVGDAGLDSGTIDMTYWSGSGSQTGVCTIPIP